MTGSGFGMNHGPAIALFNIYERRREHSLYKTHLFRNSRGEKLMGSLEEARDYHSMGSKSLLSQLTLEEKVALLSGASFTHTPGIKRLGIAQIKV
jgi:hypothetical protein